MRESRPAAQRAAPRTRSTILPTLRGVGLFVLVPALYIGGRIIGSKEMLALAAASGVVWIAAFAFMLVAPRRLSVDRIVPGGHVDDGDGARVTYRLHAPRAWLWPVQRIGELLTRRGERPEQLTISGVQANHATAVHFEALPRGVYDLGPATVTRTDPLSLFTRRAVDPVTATIRVWPRVVPLVSSLAASGLDAQIADPFVPAAGEEFRSLREFTTGDDVRRVHWKSSAKRAKLLIRETDPEHDLTAAVVLDCRSAPYTFGARRVGLACAPSAGFETAAAAAASAVRDLVRLGWAVELAPISEAGPVAVRGPADLDAAMNTLASVTPDAVSDVTMSAVFDRLRRRSGPVVLITGTPDPVLLDHLRDCRRRRPRVVVATEADSRPAGLQATWVAVQGIDELPGAWYSAALASSGGRGRLRSSVSTRFPRGAPSGRAGGRP